MMGDFVNRTLEAIARVEAPFKPLEPAWRISPEENIGESHHEELALLSQLDETKSILDALHKPTLQGHKPVHRELYRAVIHTETLAKEWCNAEESGGTLNAPAFAKWREYFLEILLAVRWWTMVTALQGGVNFTGSNIYDNLFSRKGKGASQVNDQSPTYDRHLPSYEFGNLLQDQSYLPGFLQWKIESGDIFGKDECMARSSLETIIRYPFFPSFPIKGMLASYWYVDEAESPLIEEEITMDLTRDFLGASQSGSWVIRTKCRGVDCALKRVNGRDGEQPAIARLSHPHIVQLRHYWRKDDDIFLVMELMDGDLTDLFSNHKRANESLLSLPVAVDIMLQTAKAMLYLHDLGIAYPDLNCSNVLFKKIDRRNQAMQDEYIEYTVKLSGGGYYMKDDFSSVRKMQDVYCFGLFCLEVLTGRQQRKDFLDDVADTWPSIRETIPPILRFCIGSCFERHTQSGFGFGQVVRLLLLAHYQVLKGQKNEAVLSFGSEVLELNQHGSRIPSTADADFQKYCVHQLYPEPDISGSDSDLSATLIFFHGFAKSPDEWKSTWMTRNREHIWPKAWLPKDLHGNVRVLSVSYDADSVEYTSVHEIGRRFLSLLIHSSKWNLTDPNVKVILIGHGFGGLIIKSLVVAAHNQAGCLSWPIQLNRRNSLEFLENLKGIVFYSVPGSPGQDELFEQYIMRLDQTGVLRRSSLMQALLKDKRSFNQEMQSLSSEFEEMVPEKTKILAFIAGKGMRRICEKQVVVSYASARAQLKKADFTILVEDNHFEVCRPVSPDHKGYKILVEHFLKGILETGFSLQDNSVKLSVDSPEQSISLMASSSQRYSSHSLAISSITRETPSHGSDFQLGDTSGIAAPPPLLHEKLQAFRYVLDEGEAQEAWPRYPPLSLDSSDLRVSEDPLDSAFKARRHTQVVQRKEGSANQWLLRRCFEFMRHISNLPQINQLLAAPVKNLGPRLTSSSSREALPEVVPSSGQRLLPRFAMMDTRGSAHGVPAVQHKISERKRRMRFQENLTALRELVPIISKDDKVATLRDTINYVKDLQAQIQDLQADGADMQSRYKKLKLSHEELQERIKQLEAMVAATSSEGATPILPPPNGQGKPAVSLLSPMVSSLSVDGFPLMAGPNFQPSDGNPTAISVLRQFFDKPKFEPKSDDAFSGFQPEEDKPEYEPEPESDDVSSDEELERWL